MDAEQLLTLALELPLEQRAELAGRLLESLDQAPDDGVEQAWSEEIRRRLDRLNTGEATTLSFSAARRRIRTAAGLAP